MVNMTRPQRVALHNVYQRVLADRKPSQGHPPGGYRRFRRTVQPGPGCVMVPYAGMWLGIEPDGYTHS